jgi:hypothetical protein
MLDWLQIATISWMPRVLRSWLGKIAHPPMSLCSFHAEGVLILLGVKEIRWLRFDG